MSDRPPRPPQRPQRAPRTSGSPTRTALLAGAVVAVPALMVALWALGQIRREPVAIEVPPAPLPVPAPVEDRRTLTPATFAELSGWGTDAAAQALAAFRRSCANGFQRSGGELAEQLAPALGPVCERAASVADGDAAARAFFESEFVPYAVANHDDRVGLLTAYYEPELRGDRRKHPPYVHPLYLAPDDRVIVDLGEFKQDLAGRKITGRIERGRFRPYFDRAEIENGALRGRKLELLYVDDPVALFFLQIQGSGRVVLPGGQIVRVGYSAQNGHDYTAIGKVLVEKGAMTLEEVSLQSIRAWLRANPNEAESVMNTNRSYVFFRQLPGTASIGAEGIDLTPARSLAVDPRYLPYGLPLWLETKLPIVPELGRTTEEPYSRLAIAQDTGGAIKGPVRADLFLGPGQEAEELAGRMKQPLKLWLLWPKGAVAPESAVADAPTLSR